MPCGVLCAPLRRFSFRVYTFIPLYVSFRVHPVWRSCGYPRIFAPGVWCFQRLYIARLRRSGMPIAAPYCSPCRASAAPLRPWAGCALAPAAPEGATPHAVPVSERKTPLISISGTGGVFLPEPAPKSLGVKSRPRQPFSRSAGLNYSRWGKSCHCFCSRKSLRLIRPFRRQL